MSLVLVLVGITMLGAGGIALWEWRKGRELSHSEIEFELPPRGGPPPPTVADLVEHLDGGSDAGD